MHKTHRILSRDVRSRPAGFAATGLLLAALTGTVTIAAPPARAADKPAPAPARAGPSEKDREREKERQKWERKIEFYTQEQDSSWSLRIMDKEATERATIRLTEVWKYDVETKKWIKIDEGAGPAKIVLPSEKPQNSPEDSQVIAELPMAGDAVGLYYAKWRVNADIDGATMARIGPGLTPKASKDASANPPRIPKGSMGAIVPVDKNRAEYLVIPDPRFNTPPDPNVAGAAPATKPAK